VQDIMFALPDQRETMDETNNIGFGLVISRQLADMVSATLSVDSTIGAGTRVTVTGPTNTACDGQRYTGAITAALRDTQALIVDADIAARRLLEAHLRSWGVDVRSVLDFESAVERIEKASQRNHSISMVFASDQIGSASVQQLRDALGNCEQHRDAMLVVISAGHTGTLASRISNVMLHTPIQPTELFDCIAQHPYVNAQDETESSGQADTIRQVLLVEDNIVNQCVASEILKRIGVNVDIANNGVEALQRLDSKHYDFVFMDCQMPEMDGFQATSEIRQRANLEKLPVVALTANALSGDRQRCLDAGMNDYLTKPFTKDQLEAMLNKWVNIEHASPTQTDDSAFGETELINSVALDQIRMLDSPGETSIFDEILGEYQRTSDELVTQIGVAVEGDDGKEVSRCSHALKSSSAAVGLACFARLCGELEQLGKTNDIAEIKACWLKAERCYRESLPLLTDARNRMVA
ncbi:MAG: response regulator, partial [Coleofasciculaceae cyanobacterium]